MQVPCQTKRQVVGGVCSKACSLPVPLMLSCPGRNIAVFPTYSRKLGSASAQQDVPGGARTSTTTDFNSCFHCTTCRKGRRAALGQRFSHHADTSSAVLQRLSQCYSDHLHRAGVHVAGKFAACFAVLPWRARRGLRRLSREG